MTRPASLSSRHLWIFVRDTGTLSQGAAERNVLARGLVERDHEIIWRDVGRRDHAVVQGLQQAQSLSPVPALTLTGGSHWQW